MEESSTLIIGASGQLSLALQDRYPQARTVGSQQLDISNSQQVEAFDWSGLQTVINAAAYTDVDGSESPEGRVNAWKVNAVGAASLARIAIKHDLTLVHISSDYVFDGVQSPHYEAEGFSPLGVYGQSKAAGDISVSLVPKHYIVRTTWVIGEGNNFVRTMLNLGKRGIAPKVVNDQIGRLTFTAELVLIIDHLLTRKPAYGVYNATNGGESVSWADITRTIFTLADNNLSVTDTTTAEYFQDKPQSARRPLNSILDLTKLQATGYTVRDWQEDLTAYIQKELSS